ncbi:sugar phosphate isomerase/epimerase family protein [Nocardioides sp. Kera G14]|uniref:sugar phosphate isomerase/epimerase family protein n=1 Tax=Nocardioides sp. Kera G14 TaxID=2884264 RepID=UPI001D12061A|nr:sugar phosphate isomerase/epimerase [Nocardioides sp. Kera G14]UDY23867.1 sugar phosphate isomerase/epimerase [Nocardioides sp. Kera G14]
MSGESPVRIGLSTVSVYPESTAAGFDWAVQLGYDAVEVMVGIDRDSTNIESVRQLAEGHGIAVSAIHSPCLLFTQRVWGTEPWGKLERSAEMAHAVGAETVVVHPPFRWQRDYARYFVEGIKRLERETGLRYAVENMYPWKARSTGRASGPVAMYLPDRDPSIGDFAHGTIDVSHAAIGGDDVIEMAERWGDRLAHIHLTDGTGSAKDEHLVPGRGTMGADRFLQHLARTGFDGEIIVEITTRKAGSREARREMLAESLAFARKHLTT